MRGPRSQLDVYLARFQPRPRPSPGSPSPAAPPCSPHRIEHRTASRAPERRAHPRLPPGCPIIRISDSAPSLRQRFPGIILLVSKGFTYALDRSTAANRLSLVGKEREPTAAHTSGGIQGTGLRECDLPPLFPNEMCASLRQAGQER